MPRGQPMTLEEAQNIVMDVKAYTTANTQVGVMAAADACGYGYNRYNNACSLIARKEKRAPGVGSESRGTPFLDSLPDVEDEAPVQGVSKPSKAKKVKKAEPQEDAEAAEPEIVEEEQPHEEPCEGHVRVYIVEGPISSVRETLRSWLE